MKAMVGIMLAAIVVIIAGSLYTAHKMERCVAGIMHAQQRQHIATWEAVEKCQRQGHE